MEEEDDEVRLQELRKCNYYVEAKLAGATPEPASDLQGSNSSSRVKA